MTVYFPDREEMTESEKQLFLADFKKVCSEYFEGAEKYAVDVTRTPQGFSVYVIFDVRRIKNFRKPIQ